MANYEIIEGNRKNTTFFYFENRLYIKNNESNNVTYLVCRDKKCQARARLQKNIDNIVNTGTHTCPELNANEVDIMKLKSKIKANAETTSTSVSLREVFDDTVRDSGAAGSVSYPKMESTLRKRRQKCSRPSQYTEEAADFQSSSETCLMKYCSAKGCTNANRKAHCRERKISFHGFPLKRPDILQTWLVKIQRKDFQPTESSVICSDHFDEDAFQYQPFTGRRQLKQGAIPTKFPHIPAQRSRKRAGEKFSHISAQRRRKQTHERNMKVDVILPAAGTSERMKLPTAKQFLKVLGKHIIAYTVDSFHRLPWVRHIVVVVNADQIEFTRALMDCYGFSKVMVCAGGVTRHRSIHCGVKALKAECRNSDVVIIHDAARPFVPEDVALQVAEAAKSCGAAGVTRPLVSTVIRGDKVDHRLTESLDRSQYRNSEMPQAFHYCVIASAYDKCSEEDFDHGTECLLLALKYSGCRASLVEGTDDLWKVTYQKDLYSMESIVKEKLTLVSIMNCCHEEFPALNLGQLKVTNSSDDPANTFLVVLDFQSYSTLELRELSSKIIQCYRALPYSAVGLDLMVVVVLVQESHETGSRTDLDVNAAAALPAETFQEDTQPKTARNSKLSLTTVKKELDNTQNHQEQQVTVRSVLRTNKNNRATCESLITDNESQRENSNTNALQQPYVDCQHVKHESLDIVENSQNCSHDVHPKCHSSFRDHQFCSVLIRSVKDWLLCDSNGKLVNVVGISCKKESCVAEQIAELIWNRSSCLDGQVLIYD